LRSEMSERRPAPKALMIFADPVFERDDPRLSLNEGVRRHAAASKPVHVRASQSLLRSDELSAEAKGRLRFQRLPFATTEATAIASLVPEQQCRLALGFGASLSAATSPDLQQYRILHFATHGLIYGEYSELYGVVL